MVTFGSGVAGGTMQCFSLDFVDDGQLEGNENFNVSINCPGANLGQFPTATVTIQDGDGMFLFDMCYA